MIKFIRIIVINKMTNDMYKIKIQNAVKQDEQVK